MAGVVGLGSLDRRIIGIHREDLMMMMEGVHLVIFGGCILVRVGRRNCTVWRDRDRDYGWKAIHVYNVSFILNFTRYGAYKSQV